MLLLCGQISMWMSAAPAGGLLMWIHRCSRPVSEFSTLSPAHLAVWVYIKVIIKMRSYLKHAVTLLCETSLFKIALFKLVGVSNWLLDTGYSSTPELGKCVLLLLQKWRRIIVICSSEVHTSRSISNANSMRIHLERSVADELQSWPKFCWLQDLL